jgi:hypothetical protein
MSSGRSLNKEGIARRTIYNALNRRKNGQSSQNGPKFGLYDIAIANKANLSSNSGDVYKHPKYAFKSNEARTFLAGAEYLQLTEIEVYTKNQFF